jgi:hypothetical protein
MVRGGPLGDYPGSTFGDITSPSMMDGFNDGGGGLGGGYGGGVEMPTYGPDPTDMEEGMGGNEGLFEAGPMMPQNNRGVGTNCYPGGSIQMTHNYCFTLS